MASEADLKKKLSSQWTQMIVALLGTLLFGGITWFIMQGDKKAFGSMQTFATVWMIVGGLTFVCLAIVVWRVFSISSIQNALRELNRKQKNPE